MDLYFFRKFILTIILVLILYPFLSTAVTVDVSASPQAVLTGGSSLISWTSSGATECTLSGGGITGSGTTNPGVSTGPISNDTTYTVVCTTPSGTLSATSCEISAGGSTCVSVLNWTTEDLTANPTEVTRNNPDNTHVSWATSGVNIPNSVNYGPSTFYLYHNNGVILAQAPINASCASGTIWDSSTSKCISSGGGGMSGTLTPVSPTCSIPEGASSCNINFSWNVSNPEIPTGSAVTSNTPIPNTVVATGDIGNNIPFEVFYSTRTFFLYNNSVLLAQSTVYSDCVTGTYWDSVSGVCKVSTESLEVNLTADPISISQGQSTNLTWSSNGDYCTSDFFSGQRPASGNSLATPPTLPYTYTVECFGLGQQASRSIVILNSYKKQPIYVEPQ